MKRYLPLVICFLVWFWPQEGFGLSSRDIIRLTEAGISGETLAMLAQEKTIQTGVFSVTELVDLKHAGVSDETLQMLIYTRSQMRGREPVRYGEDTRTLRFLTVQDILKLKDEGVSDDVIRTVVIHTQKSKYADQRAEAMELLKDMGIIIDLREDQDSE